MRSKIVVKCVLAAGGMRENVVSYELSLCYVTATEMASLGSLGMNLFAFIRG